MTTNYYGQLLVSMPHINDKLFSQSVILIIEHTADAVIGLMTNKKDDLSPSTIRKEVGLNLTDEEITHLNIMNGGPVYFRELNVIHRLLDNEEKSQSITSSIGVTASDKIIHQIARNEFSQPNLVTRGYSVWTPEQLTDEIKRNYWMLFPLENHIIFNQKHDLIWSQIFSYYGINISTTLPTMGTS